MRDNHQLCFLEPSLSSKSTVILVGPSFTCFVLHIQLRAELLKWINPPLLMLQIKQARGSRGQGQVTKARRGS